MANLTFSSILEPATPYADSLSGGGTGIEFGVATNAGFTPISDKANNLGHLDLYVSHDGVAPITAFKSFIQVYGTNTGFTYGGAATALADYNTFVALGGATGTSKNNADGNSGGLWREMQWDVSDANRFDLTSRAAFVFAHGLAAAGVDEASGFTMLGTTMVYDSTGETAASAAVDGQLGEAGNTTLGDVCHDQLRIYIPTSFATSGILQFEIGFTFVD